MIKKFFSLLICLVITGCAAPQKKVEKTPVVLLPFQVAAKGVADGGRVILGMLQIPVIILLFPLQFLRDLHEAEHVVEKSIRPFPKPDIQ